MAPVNSEYRVSMVQADQITALQQSRVGSKRTGVVLKGAGERYMLYTTDSIEQVVAKMKKCKNPEGAN